MRPEKLYRYSSKKWLEKSYYEGVFRLVSASYIEDLDNDKARQDNERKVTLNLDKNRTSITCAKTGKAIFPTSDITYEDEFLSDYYMLCLTTGNDSYFYNEFEGSDSCLTIHNTEEFSRRIYNVTDRVLKKRRIGHP